MALRAVFAELAAVNVHVAAATLRVEPRVLDGIPTHLRSPQLRGQMAAICTPRSRARAPAETSSARGRTSRSGHRRGHGTARSSPSRTARSAPLGAGGSSRSPCFRIVRNDARCQTDGTSCNRSVSCFAVELELRLSCCGRKSGSSPSPAPGGSLRRSLRRNAPCARLCGNRCRSSTGATGGGARPGGSPGSGSFCAWPRMRPPRLGVRD